MTDDDKKLQEVYNRIYELSSQIIIKETVDPQIVAATLMAQALKLYKSILSEDDFKKMVETITESVDKILNYQGNRTIN